MILLEGVLEEAEIRRDLRCTMPCAMNVVKIAKYPLDQAGISRFIAVIVLRQKVVETTIGQAGEVLVIAVLTIEIPEGLQEMTPVIVAQLNWQKKLES